MSKANDEMLDVFDEDGVWQGTASRTEVHQLGLWHRTFHCLVVCERQGVPTTVLQRRHTSKIAFPGRLDISATGHLEAGEQPVDGIRELIEELGIEPDPADLIPLGVRKLVDLIDGEGQNREQTHVFLLEDDRSIDQYRPDPIELLGVYDAPLATLVDLMDGTTAHADIEGFTYDEAGRLSPHTWTVTAEDLILDDSNYFPELIALAARHLEGETNLTISHT